jgi:transposase
MIEVLDGRNRRVVELYLQELPDRHRRAIGVVSIDPYEAYRQAIKVQLPRQ